VYDCRDYSCTDVFAFGMVVYFVLMGERPFAEAIPEEIPSLVKAGSRPDVTKLPMEFQELVSRCWVQGRADHVEFARMTHAVLQIRRNA
jgi:hypothetical protein